MMLDVVLEEARFEVRQFGNLKNLARAEIMNMVGELSEAKGRS